MKNCKTDYNYAFVGKTSWEHSEEELKCFRKHVANVFDNDGGMVITYSKDQEIKGIDCLSRLWHLDMRALRGKGRVFFLCRDDYIENDQVNIRGLIKSIENGIDFLNENGSKSNTVYVTIDTFWHFYKEEDFEFAHNSMKSIGDEKKNKFLFRYIAKELNEEQIFYLLNYHEYIFIDGLDSFEIYTPQELLFNSLVLKSEYSLVNQNYQKEMERVEHLRTLGELMENTVHDVNNLLTTISGYAQLSLAKENDPDAESYLSIINKTALDGRNVIDKIRCHTRGSYTKEKELYKINHIIEDCISMTEHKFKTGSTVNGNQLRLKIDLKSQGYIYVNEYEVRQSILNLILNGVDAMFDGGVLTIRSYDIDDLIFLEIEDTGEGIDGKIINKIFDSHFTTKGSQGTGLGLNIVKKIVKSYNGEISVNSNLGKGTKFTLSFPIEESEYFVAEAENKSYNII